MTFLTRLRFSPETIDVKTLNEVKATRKSLGLTSNYDLAKYSK